MLNIPETLLKLSNKELQSVLTEDKHKAKYFVDLIGSFDRSAVYTKKSKIDNTILVQGEKETPPIALFYKDFHRVFTPLTIKTYEEELNNYKLTYLLTYLKQAPIETKVKYLDSVFSKVYNTENYEITVNVEYIRVVVYYPEIKITNTAGLEHTMLDVYVKYKFHPNLNLISISLARATVTNVEYINQYVFSHSASIHPGKYSTAFCWGDDTLINNMFCRLQSGDIIKLSLFLHSFDSYLSWESVEGKPYIYISKVQHSSSFKPVSYSDYISTPTLLQKVIENIEDIDFTYTLEQNDVYIPIITTEGQNVIDKILTQAFPEYCYFTVNNVSCYISSDNELDISNVNKTTDIMFKRENKKLSIIPHPIKDAPLPEKRIHRDILNMVVNEIQGKLNLFIMNNYKSGFL